MPATTRPRLLAKLNPQQGKALTATGLRFSRVGYTVEPLFQPIPGAAAMGLSGADQWFLVSANEDLDPVHAWDLAHEARKSDLSSATLLEPDIEHKWTYQNPTALAIDGMEFSAAEKCVFNDQNPRGGATPAGEGFAWFLGRPGFPQYSELKAARDFVGTPTKRVRIAHLDTGYDPAHVAKPANIFAEHSFVDDDPDPNSARDPSERGLLKNPGHGTGTLSILAGGKLTGVKEADWLKGDFLGGCPHADMVLVRIAESVVLFRSSAFIRGVDFALRQGCAVLSMSMGGVASAAWTDVVNTAYEQGLVMVTAAGNNFGGIPARSIVYPARYNRVIAACGAMANGTPYFGLPPSIMQGNNGPESKMRTALSAYTPNMPWAELGCGKIVDMDGQGTSSATPQIAATAALWLMYHDPAYAQPWMRVEAARKALFGSAEKPDGSFALLGQGLVRARKALDIAPAAAKDLKKEALDNASFAAWRVIFGQGFAGDAANDLLALEASQLSLSATIESLLPDPDLPIEAIDARDRQAAIEAIRENPNCSVALKEALGGVALKGRSQGAVPARTVAAISPKVPAPSSRRLRTYAFDPSLGLDLDARVMNRATVEIPWESDLKPGPIGEYLEIVDIDPSSGFAYAPVDLNEPHLLAQDGHPPSEGNPQFHQQMVYAVAMRTIKNFESALGRVALWSPRVVRDVDVKRSQFKRQYVQRLRIYPHALRQANAYYSGEKKALLFGYFPAARTRAGKNLPGGTVFTCLSHGIVAHETTHALLDGLHPRFTEATNPDVFAFHEAFADIVALFQHFTFPEVLLNQINKTRGDLEKQNLLGELAQQFGQALGQYGALRDAIGTFDENGNWHPKQPDPEEFRRTEEPHARGAILVAAVFEAFLAIYKRRIRDLVRIASGGTGVLPEGEIHPDLASRMTREASETAQDVLQVCIRALDYCPPIDITMGDYLRALVTADWDLSSSDDLGYRVAFIEAFRRRGIYPEAVRTLSEESLRWREPDYQIPGLEKILDAMDLNWDLFANRRKAWDLARKNQAKLHEWLRHHKEYREIASTIFGFYPEREFEVHAVRPSRRTRYDGTTFTDIVVEITQRKESALNPADPKSPSFIYRGGCTMLIDLRERRIRYVVRKRMTDEKREDRQREYMQSPGGVSLYATYFGSRTRQDEPFALLHRSEV